MTWQNPRMPKPRNNLGAQSKELFTAAEYERLQAEYDALQAEKQTLAQQLEVTAIERDAFRGVLVDQGRVEQPRRRLRAV